MKKVIYENHSGRLLAECIDGVVIKFKQFDGYKVTNTISMFVEELTELSNWITENRVVALDD